MKVFNTLKEAHIPSEEVEKLASFVSRDGFMFIGDDEYESVERFFNQFSVFKGLCPMLSDEASNYWCVFTEGARKGLVCYFNHEEQDRLEPRFKNISSLIDAIEKHPDACDFDDLNELSESVFDYPEMAAEDALTREHIISELYREIVALPDDACADQARSSRIYAIITLATASDIEKHIKPFLTDEDTYVAEFAEKTMKFWKKTLFLSKKINLL